MCQSGHDNEQSQREGVYRFLSSRIDSAVPEFASIDDASKRRPSTHSSVSLRPQSNHAPFADGVDWRLWIGTHAKQQVSNEGMPAVSVAHVLEGLIVKAPRGRNPCRVEDWTEWDGAARQTR